MKVVYSASHLLHNPEVEIESSTAHSPFEHTGRAEKIRETLAADKAFDFVSPNIKELLFGTNLHLFTLLNSSFSLVKNP